MTSTLWSKNTPASLWLCQPEVPKDEWQAAIQRAIPVLDLPYQPNDIDHLLALVLGEEQFGPKHWQLSLVRRGYYVLKPLLPHPLTCFLRRLHCPSARANFPLGWPIEERYARFQWEVMRQLVIAAGGQSLNINHFWPNGQRFAFILTHDIESNEGQAFARSVADLEESFGFRSSFNFVPERYPLDHGLIEELRERGFEIGVHGLKHDGKLFHSEAEFMRRVTRINAHLKALNAVGFRSPLTMRNPAWMQSLEVEYDLSFFDTDPYEPMPGGVMSIWPFMIGHFVELPYTLIQDCTLHLVLGESTPRLWLEKVGFIERYHGMVLLNTHPDYLKKRELLKIYIEFLQAMKQKEEYWHALPREVGRWWRQRSEGIKLGTVGITDPNKTTFKNGRSRFEYSR